MKQFILLIIACMLLTVAGCRNLMHKSFTTTLHVKGGRITFTDPSSEQPTPTVVFGQLTNSVMTVPFGCKVKRALTTYQWWTSKPSYHEEIEIDATKAKPEVVEQIIKAMNHKR